MSKPQPPTLVTSFSEEFDHSSGLSTAGPLYTAIKTFNSRLEDELSLQIGDRIEVIADDSEFNDGWYMGRKVATGETGLYPKSFTQIALGSTQLLRSMSRRNMNVSSPSGLVGLGPPAPFGSQNTSSPNLSGSANTTNGSLYGRITTNATTNATANATMSDIDRAIEELGLPKTAEGLHPEEAALWTAEQVTAYFTNLGFDVESAGQFARHRVNGQILLELELTYLKELDISSFGTRFEMYKEIEVLKRAAQSQGLAQGTPIQGTQTSGLAQGTPIQGTQTSGLSLGVRATPTVSTAPAASALSPGIFDSPRKAPHPYNPRSPGLNPRTPSVNAGLNAGVFPRTPSAYRSLLDPLGSPNHSRGAGANSGALARPMSSMGLGSPNTNWLLPDETKPNKLKHHRRHSSLFSFASFTSGDKKSAGHLRKPSALDMTGIPATLEETRFAAAMQSTPGFFDLSPAPYGLSPARAHSISPTVNREANNLSPLRAALDNFKFGAKPPSKRLVIARKKNTSAFQEGIQQISPDEAIRLSEHSGWMSKRGSLTIGTWRTRYFTLHKTRLLYFGSLKDKHEKGLIDITAHKVLPARAQEDKFVAMYAASTGSGSYCFKLVPPAPGTKKGLTFTQQKVHYFAVETQDEMRDWMAALMKATIDIDETVPVVSSCVTPTISLPKAQEMLARAREETRLKDDQLRSKGFLQQGYSYNLDEDPAQVGNSLRGDVNSNYLNEETPSVASTQADLSNAMFDPTRTTSLARTTSALSAAAKLHLSGTGFASPFLLAAGAYAKSPPSPRDARVKDGLEKRLSHFNA